MKFIAAMALCSVLIASCDSSHPKEGAAGQGATGKSDVQGGTGIWEKALYTDELGQTSDREYIRNKESIAGSFSNLATPHGTLTVRFMVFNPGSIFLQLFENAGNDPVKTLTPVSYTVTIDDADRRQHQVKALNYSDRLAFEKSDAGTLHDILVKGGRIQFIITNDFNPRIQYQFTIDDARGYAQAYGQITKH